MEVCPGIDVSTYMAPPVIFKKVHIFLSKSVALSLHNPLIPGQKIPIICPVQGTLLTDYVWSR